MANTSDERRKHPRFECELLACVFDEAGESYAADSIDVSETGVALRLDRVLEVDARVEVLLTVHFGWTETDFVRLPGRIVWCRRDGEGARLGVEFCSEDLETQRDRLALLIRAVGAELGSVAPPSEESSSSV